MELLRSHHSGGQRIFQRHHLYLGKNLKKKHPVSKLYDYCLYWRVRPKFRFTAITQTCGIEYACLVEVQNFFGEGRSFNKRTSKAIACAQLLGKLWTAGNPGGGGRGTSPLLNWSPKPERYVSDRLKIFVVPEDPPPPSAVAEERSLSGDGDETGDEISLYEEREGGSSPQPSTASCHRSVLLEGDQNNVEMEEEDDSDHDVQCLSEASHEVSNIFSRRVKQEPPEPLHSTELKEEIRGSPLESGESRQDSGFLNPPSRQVGGFLNPTTQSRQVLGINQPAESCETAGFYPITQTRQAGGLFSRTAGFHQTAQSRLAPGFDLTTTGFRYVAGLDESSEPRQDRGFNQTSESRQALGFNPTTQPGQTAGFDPTTETRQTAGCNPTTEPSQTSGFNPTTEPRRAGFYPMSSESVRRFISPRRLSPIAEIPPMNGGGGLDRDPIAYLNECCQKRQLGQPLFPVTQEAEGKYWARCLLSGNITYGKGETIREARKIAARRMLLHYNL